MPPFPYDTAFIDNSSVEAVIDTSAGMFVAAEIKFEFTVTGLKPNTTHVFYFEDTIKTSKCRPQGGVIGSTLVTNEEGSISFEYYHDSGVPANTTFTSFVQAQSQLSSLAGNKRIKLQNSDLSSYAEDIIIIRLQDAAAPVAANTSGIYNVQIGTFNIPSKHTL